MIDIHCHLLPGLDDGAKTLEQSVAMAEMAIEDGITHVVATPHANSEYKFDAVRTRERMSALSAKLDGRLALASGADFHLNLENLRDFHLQPEKYTINQKNYLLVEFSEFAIPPNAEEILHGMRLAGILPIVTHPERNTLIRNNPEMLWQWMRLGCFIQITAQSLMGKFGGKAEKAANEWLDRSHVHFVSSDAHDLQKRPLKLRAAYEVVAQRRGEEIAQLLFRDNPLAAFEGRPLPYQPEPPPGMGETTYRKKKLFGIF